MNNSYMHQTNNAIRSEITIGVLGLGHVGLPTALCLADLGWPVLGAELDSTTVRLLQSGECPFFEPGLQELLIKHLDSGNFLPTDALDEVIQASQVLFICVGTPQNEAGLADLSQVEAVARAIGCNLNGYKVIVEKSTVPIRTAQCIKRTLTHYGNRCQEFDVASNPEFLREGTAVQDFLHPDRIVLGVESPRARNLLLQIYEPLIARLDGATDINSVAASPRMCITDVSTAEIIKHASNAFLATKISFINMVSDLCEATGADVTEVARGLGQDPRIGREFLQAGVGYGGYCLPKDIRAFLHIGKEHGVDVSLLQAVDHINELRVPRIVKRLQEALWILKDKTIAVWGLAFKSGTDDIRGAPSLKLVGRLLEEGANLRLYDPWACHAFRECYPEMVPRLVYCTSAEDAAHQADAILLLTEWPEFMKVELCQVREQMALPVLIDGRNYFNGEMARQAGFEYYGVGRRGVNGHV